MCLPAIQTYAFIVAASIRLVILAKNPHTCCITLAVHSYLLQAVVAIRFCPQLFTLRDTAQSTDLPDDQQQHPFQLPYRMVFAVATLDSIIIYDTQVKPIILALAR